MYLGKHDEDERGLGARTRDRMRQVCCARHPSGSQQSASLQCRRHLSTLRADDESERSDRERRGGRSHPSWIQSRRCVPPRKASMPSHNDTYK
jgi:hypothetical protein